ncbi:MAG: Abhydrolase, bacterial [Gemmatimonadetes bacterium]|nr:Abhydrolase, bacterial [Gemmatimonadota bacterium]
MTNDIGRREFVKRSAVAGVIAATGLPSSEARAANPPAAAEPVNSVLAGRHLDSKEFCLSEYDALTPAMTFSARDAADAAAWQKRARKRLIERLGGFPSSRAPLNAQVLERVDFPTYVREKIVFDTRSNLSAIGYLLVPKSGTARMPAVVAFSGHGRGVYDILSLADDGTPRADRNGTYAKGYALQCVERGYVTFAVEQLAFGARRDEAAQKAGLGENSCRPAACAALLLGQSMAAWRVWDAMRAIDYLHTRPEVDASRIATLGASGGGTTSLLTGAVDQRVKVTVVSAYFNTFRDSIVSISHCPDNYVPGLLNDMEMYDLAGLVAPRRLFVESGRNDRIFPIAGSERAAAKARTIYQTFGVPDRLGYAIHEGAHEFNGAEAFEYMARWL